MQCLTSAQVQAVVDGECSTDEREHAVACDSCRARVAERRERLLRLSETAGRLAMAPETAKRIDAALAGAIHSGGATRLRAASPRSSWRKAAWGTTALAAATIIAVVIVAPALKQDRGAVSAAEVLAASANRLTQPTSGVEILEYELVLDGVPKELIADHADGTYRVRQTIDHRVPGRFRFASYGPDGRLVSSIAQDPAANRRTVSFNLDDQAFRFDVTIPASVGPSLPEMERLHMEATIAMMQASGNQSLQVVETRDGRQYRIEVANVQAPLVNPVWDLSEARVVVDADDFRVTELAVTGAFLKQAYSISYRLITRVVSQDMPPDTFEIPPQPGEIVIAGEGSVIPARDTVVLALRELARLKRGQ